MSRELEPCPLHKEEVIPELSTYKAKSLTPWCATILCSDCGLELSMHEYATEQDAIDAITKVWSTRYMRMCSLDEARALVIPDICGDGYDADARCDAIIRKLAELFGAEVVDGD